MGKAILVPFREKNMYPSGSRQNPAKGTTHVYQSHPLSGMYSKIL
jgi:hypothetical protein